MTTMFLPRPLDQSMLSQFLTVWPKTPAEQLYVVCPNCGHYGFERDLNFDACCVNGCSCTSSDLHWGERIRAEHMISSWGDKHLSQSLGDADEIDREKWFARHSQQAHFFSVTLKRKYAKTACAFYDAIENDGWFTIVNPTPTSTVMTPDGIVTTLNFQNEARKSVQIHLASKYSEVVRDHHAALADEGRVWLIHSSSVPPTEPLPTAGRDAQSAPEDDCPF
jgi:hypothetical protein